MSLHLHPAALALSGLLILSPIAQARELVTPGSNAAATVTVYPAAFFAGSRTYSAFDMLALLPGYEFMDGDAEVRGLAGATGNVLIDGSRPASKYESLETLLRRIPAGNVERIELIRAGTPGFDMGNHTVLANVVRAVDASTRGSLQLGDTAYARGFNAPSAVGELAHRNGDRLLELSGSISRTVDDEHGAGSRPRVSPQDEVLRDGDYSQDEGEKLAAAGAGYEDTVFGGKLRLHGSLQRTRFRADILDAVTFPAISTTTVTEFDDETSAELGMHFERPLAGNTRFELLSIQRNLRARGGERAQEPDESSLFRDDSAVSESILHALLRRSDGALAIEGGLEFALNTLDNHSSLTENDIDVPLPSADVRVEEQRGEAFATATWALTAAWNVELGARFEYSRLVQSGDSTLSKTFFFPKPRALLRWSRGPDQVRLLVERNVGQLDFEDFVSSASLSTGTVTAGNPDLEPDQTWRAELAWEHHFLDTGAVTIALRHEAIDDLVDRIPVIAAEVFDAIGNIGSGTRDEIEINLTLPLDRIGMSAGMLKAAALWRHSETTDPVTGRSRSISEDEPLEAALHFLQPLPARNARWGIDLTLPLQEREYHFDEVRTDRLGTMLNVFVEYEPARSWNVRVFANNLTDRSAVRQREVYDGMRNEAPVRYIETRTLAIGPYAGIQVQRRFGD